MMPMNWTLYKQSGVYTDWNRLQVFVIHSQRLSQDFKLLIQTSHYSKNNCLTSHATILKYQYTVYNHHLKLVLDLS